MESLLMPFAVFVAAWVTFRPDPKVTWILALPFFLLAFMFTMNYDTINPPAPQKHINYDKINPPTPLKVPPGGGPKARYDKENPRPKP